MSLSYHYVISSLCVVRARIPVVTVNYQTSKCTVNKTSVLYISHLLPFQVHRICFSSPTGNMILFNCVFCVCVLCVCVCVCVLCVCVCVSIHMSPCIGSCVAVVCVSVFLFLFLCPGACVSMCVFQDSYGRASWETDLPTFWLLRPLRERESRAEQSRARGNEEK